MKHEHLHLRFRTLIRENHELRNVCLIWPREEGQVEFSGSVGLLRSNANMVQFHASSVDEPIGFSIHDISSITLHIYSPGLTITLKP